ncbi:MAG TPA: hypothetical protein VJ804_00135 [Acidimicrobiales bacterium]|nr:hypothetical protein [Acidimicrobiales bacterium]
MATDPGAQRRVALGLAAAVVVVAAGGVGAALVVEDDDDETTTTTLAISEAGEELLDRLALARGSAAHVILSSSPEDVAAQKVTVELWRTADGDLRQDLVLEAGSLRSETRTLQRSDGDVFCQRATESEWTCRELGTRDEGDAVAGGLVEAAASDLQGADVRTSDVEILGRPARCYEVVAAAGSRSALCLGEDGTPLRLTVQGRELTATVVDEAVPDEVFDPPAEPLPAVAASSSTAA